MKKRKQVILSAIFLFLLALGLTLYPVVSNYVNQKYASKIHTTYREVMEQADNQEIQKAKENAAAYNRAIVPGATEAYSQEGLQAASEDYDNQLNVAGNGIMGYVEIPKISVDLPIYHGTENDSLERGIGHLLGSSLPIGGESTHSILSGHSGMASQKMFTDLEQLTLGDIFYLHVLDETLAYQVVDINTVLPYDTSLLRIVPSEDYLPEKSQLFRLVFSASTEGLSLSVGNMEPISSKKPDTGLTVARRWDALLTVPFCLKPPLKKGGKTGKPNGGGVLPLPRSFPLKSRACSQKTGNLSVQ